MEKITISLGGRDKMTLNMKERLTERISLGKGVPVPPKDYRPLENKPQINGVTLEGNKSTRELRIEITDPLTNTEIEEILSAVFS